jgi:hypothetical protein
MSKLTPSEYYKIPVIGTIRCKITGTMNCQPYNSEIDEYEVIKIVENDDGSKTYICNQWNSPGVAQLVPDILVLEYSEK